MPPRLNQPRPFVKEEQPQVKSGQNLEQASWVQFTSDAVGRFRNESKPAKWSSPSQKAHGNGMQVTGPVLEGRNGKGPKVSRGQVQCQ